MIADQISIKEYMDPFKGVSNRRYAAGGPF